jgi:alpha-tubulin suppressor-like RCC1 family protein
MQEITMPRLGHARFRLLPVLSLALVLAAVGCGEDAQAPTAPGPEPALAIKPAGALAFRQVSAGLFHTCGVTPGNLVYCWGQNFRGQLGDGTTDRRLTPVAVAGGLRFRQVSAGDANTCGVTTDDVAYCWGWNINGRLGDGTTIDRPTPVAVAGGLRFRQVLADGIACGLTTSDVAYCWGSNAGGRLGDGTTTESPTPVAVAGGLRFRQLFMNAGSVHTCGVTRRGQAYCWGVNFQGQLGDGTTSERPTPVAVSGGLRFREMSLSGFHTCGVTPGNVAYCWGDNQAGELGDGTTQDIEPTPVAVAGGLRFREVTSGTYHTCGVATGNVAYCWGDNSNFQLGNGGSGADGLTPGAVAGGLRFRQLSAGGDHTCGVTTGNVAYCWGTNTSGELGNGTTSPSQTPVAVAAPVP